jgi:hypothetical protein
MVYFTHGMSGSRSLGLWGVLVAIILASLPAWSGAWEQWVPARWQGGPVEIFYRKAQKTLPAEPALQTAMERWYEAPTLDLLEGAPINCLLVTWSAGADASLEKRQRQLIQSYARQARNRRIAVLGLVYPGSDPGPSADAVLDAGLDGLVLEGDFPEGSLERVRKILTARNSNALAIPLAGRKQFSRGVEWPVLAVANGVWPGVRALTESGARATSTSEPWIDSNTWVVRSLRAWSGSRPVWLDYASQNPSGGDYLRAIADAGAAGGRWIVSLDDALRAALFRREPDALARWRRITACVRFFEEHAEWRNYAPFGPLGIVQDSAGRDTAMSGENLNLIARRQIPYRVIERPDLTPSALENLTALLASDLAPPTPAERRILGAFVEKGGLLVTGRSWDPKAATGEGYAMVRHGHGRVAVYSEDPPDAEALSKDMIELVGDRNLGVRLFNAPAVLGYAASPDNSKRVLLHLVNYATAPTEGLKVRIHGVFGRARLYSPEGPARDLPLEKSEGITEVAIPRFSIYAALLWEQ